MNRRIRIVAGAGAGAVLAAGVWLQWNELAALTTPETANRTVDAQTGPELDYARPEAASDTVVVAAGNDGVEQRARLNELQYPSRGRVEQLRRQLLRSDRLPAESPLLTGDSLAIDNIRQVMESDDFDLAMERLAAQSEGDPLAVEMTELSRRIVESEVALAGAGALDRLSCGMRICMAALQPSEGPRWDAFLRAWRQNQHSLHFASVAATVERPDGAPEYRLVFSTDPASNSIVVRAPPYPPPGG